MDLEQRYLSILLFDKNWTDFNFVFYKITELLGLASAW